MSRFFAVSGVKNSGKTTLITKLLPILKARGLKVATIKHDGHDFGTDVPGTDTFAHFQAGAYGTAVFSDYKYMVVKEQPVESPEERLTPEQMAAWFPEADLILLEGFKDSDYPKLEIIRSENSSACVCKGHHLCAVVTDLPPEEIEDLPEDIPLFAPEDAERIADFIFQERRKSSLPDMPALHFKTKLILSKEQDFFGPGVYHLLQDIDETGSIQAAAAKMNMSYSKSWKMINKVEKELGFRFLNRCNGGKNGGSSTITPEGRLFMERYRAMLEDMRRITGGFFETYFGK